MLAAPNAPPADSAPRHTNLAASASEPRPPTHPTTAPGASQRAAAGRVATGTAGPRPQARPEGRGLHALAAGAGTTPSAAGAGGGSGEMEEDDDSASQASGEVQQDPDPFYDEAADEKDAAWADRQRSGRVSDAVLSCPGCFTTLCIDCQRHEKYHQQYRAMFVMNCVVDEQEEGGGGGGGGRGGEGFDPAAVGGGSGGRRSKRAKGSAAYQRVRCGVCDTEVGALEVEEELYHFYHVFPSNA